MNLPRKPWADKKEWWQSVHEARQLPDWKPSIIQVSFWKSGERHNKPPSPLEEYVEAFDYWLGEADGIKTYPQDLFAICLSEENTTSGCRGAILSGLARHIKKMYGVAVYQFLSAPMRGDQSLAGDGWVLDIYGWTGPVLRKHLMSFVMLGKPVMNIIWMTEPGLSGYYRDDWHAKQILSDAEDHFARCREFDIAPVLFACGIYNQRGYGSGNAWYTDMPSLNNMRKYCHVKQREIAALGPGDTPQVSANFSVGRIIHVGADRENLYRYDEQFEGSRFIDDADLTGFLDMLLTPHKTLQLKVHEDRPSTCSLTFQFKS